MQIAGKKERACGLINFRGTNRPGPPSKDDATHTPQALCSPRRDDTRVCGATGAREEIIAIESAFLATNNER